LGFSWFLPFAPKGRNPYPVHPVNPVNKKPIFTHFTSRNFWVTLCRLLDRIYRIYRISWILFVFEIHDELVESRKGLLSEQGVGPSFITFCYPNANYNDKIVSTVQNTGYSLAATTKNGWSHARSDPFTLRQIGIHQDMASTEAMLGCRIVGIL